MNEKYQQALDRLKEVQPAISLPLGTNLDECYVEEFDTLQELVDMMKPLERKEINVGDKIIIVSNHTGSISHVVSLATVSGFDLNGECICDFNGNESFLDINQCIKNGIKCYRNIWEVE